MNGPLEFLVLGALFDVEIIDFTANRQKGSFWQSPHSIVHSLTLSNWPVTRSAIPRWFSSYSGATGSILRITSQPSPPPPPRPSFRVVRWYFSLSLFHSLLFLLRVPFQISVSSLNFDLMASVLVPRNAWLAMTNGWNCLGKRFQFIFLCIFSLFSCSILKG